MIMKRMWATLRRWWVEAEEMGDQIAWMDASCSLSRRGQTLPENVGRTRSGSVPVRCETPADVLLLRGTEQGRNST